MNSLSSLSAWLLSSGGVLEPMSSTMASQLDKEPAAQFHGDLWIRATVLSNWEEDAMADIRCVFGEELEVLTSKRTGAVEFLVPGLYQQELKGLHKKLHRCGLSSRCIETFYGVLVTGGLSGTKVCPRRVRACIYQALRSSLWV